PSIPGAEGFAEFRPLAISTPDSIRLDPPGPGSIDIPLPGQISSTTPLPDGNLANVDDRWALLESDTLPAYQRLLADDPGLAGEIIGSDVADRIEANRLHHHVDDIAERLSSGWDIQAHR
ncbi:MAG: WXG100 family type VII secretion target, partial [Sporichthyaceae bacterium]